MVLLCGLGVLGGFLNVGLYICRLVCDCIDPDGVFSSVSIMLPWATGVSSSMLLTLGLPCLLIRSIMWSIFASYSHFWSSENSVGILFFEDFCGIMEFPKVFVFSFLLSESDSSLFRYLSLCVGVVLPAYMSLSSLSIFINSALTCGYTYTGLVSLSTPRAVSFSLISVGISGYRILQHCV